MTSKLEIIKIQMARIQKEIRDLPYHKGTEHHHGMMKAKLAMLEDQLAGGGTKSGGGGGGGVGYAIKHSGDVSVVLIGLPSVGKSTLLNALTNAISKIGNYDFTTLGVVPGMMYYKGIAVQILDLPGIVEGAANNRGFGRKVLSVARGADLVMLITDVARMGWFEIVEKELYENGMRMNTRAAKITVIKTFRGSIEVVNPFGGLQEETVVEICKMMGMGNARIIFEEKVEEIDLLVDALVKNRKYVPMMKVVTKIDLATKDQLKKVPKDALAVSSVKELNLEELKEMIWKKLGLVRVYLKRERNGEADKIEPMILRRGQTLDDVLKLISSEMRQDVARAYIWGKEARFAAQEVSFSYLVFDEMEVWFGR